MGREAWLAREEVTSPTTLDTSSSPDPLLLTIEQVAERLQVGRCTAQGLITSGEIRSFKIGRLRRVPVEALAEFIAQRSTR